MTNTHVGYGLDVIIRRPSSTPAAEKDYRRCSDPTSLRILASFILEAQTVRVSC